MIMTAGSSIISKMVLRAICILLATHSPVTFMIHNITGTIVHQGLRIPFTLAKLAIGSSTVTISESSTSGH